MKLRTMLACWLGIMSAASGHPEPIESRDTVVLLHGLGRTRFSMVRLAHTLERNGYRVVNLTYPSRTVPLEALAQVWLPAQLAELALAPPPDQTRKKTRGKQAGTPALPRSAEAHAAPRFHLVTHSMGGIIVRLWLRDHPPPTNLGRVVMLAPPNAGSEVSDKLNAFAPFRWFTGVNGRRLGTGPDALPRTLGPWPVANCDLAIIAGDRSFNPLFSVWLPGADDGKVTVAATHLAAEQDHIVLPHSHTWLAWREATADQVISFLRTGRFWRPS